MKLDEIQTPQQLKDSAVTRFTTELQRVLENAFDPNTNFTIPRKLKLEVIVRPDTQKRTAVFDIIVHRTLSEPMLMGYSECLFESDYGTIIAENSDTEPNAVEKGA